MWDDDAIPDITDESVFQFLHIAFLVGVFILTWGLVWMWGKSFGKRAFVALFTNGILWWGYYKVYGLGGEGI